MASRRIEQLVKIFNPGSNCHGAKQDPICQRQRALQAARVKKKAVRWNGAPGLKGQRRETILRSVGNVLRNSGLSSLTIQDIADELGMTKGNLYYYFKDKQDILYQCHMRCMDISLRALKQAMAADGTAGEKLRILLVGHIHGVLDDGFGSILQTDLESFWPDQRKQYVSKRDRARTRRSQPDRGRPAVPANSSVTTSSWRVSRSSARSTGYRSGIGRTGRCSADEIADGMVDYFLRGLRRDGAARKRLRGAAAPQRQG